MASHPLLSLIVYLLTPSFIISHYLLAAAAPPPPTKALVAPIAYDPPTSLYSVSSLAGPLFNRPLLLSLASSNLWQDCLHPLYESPTLQPVHFHSAICNSATVQSSLMSARPGYSMCTGPPSPVCSNSSCTTYISASVSSTAGNLWTDTLSFVTTDGRNPGATVETSKFAFVCSDDILLSVKNSVPSGSFGAAGLSRALLALPNQLAAKLSIKRKFTYCLPSSGYGKGVLFFGESPYVFLPGMDFSRSFQYTPLLNNPRETDSYYIGVKAISVDGIKLPIDSNLLKLRNSRTIKLSGGIPAIVGGTLISSTARYTQLESSIYDALSHEFKSAAEARGIKAVPAISPFETCFNASTALSTRVGYNVPEIELLLQGSGGVAWPFSGANSVVQMGDDGAVICLAFQRADFFEPRAIILGTFQQQDALLQFDLADSKLGFVPTLLPSMTTCSNFNFTPTAPP